MITKETLAKQQESIKEKLDSIYRDLENIWECARANGDTRLMQMADRAQHWNGSILEIKSDISFLIDDIYGVVDENEKTKELPKLLNYMMAFDQIKADVKRWDKILYPEDYKSEEE